MQHDGNVLCVTEHDVHMPGKTDASTLRFCHNKSQRNLRVNLSFAVPKTPYFH